ncbi:putative ABC transport system ATP-binding protein [Granulicatella balaenopterae]|uniref:Putative ABC transport system ATP-binding protein n=1 Tax=Granulicatella balaenopterae TaxID=137733 RepID=A0A1H9M6H5_9LACT|nr:ABC transporter ATP-binding protein [Granulicatella balaenopterae]SER19288.1 putative ABC transport system ATP-binding protein [Granulicatella balaenopterae]
MTYISIQDESKIYGTGEAKTIANDHISFEIEEGEFVVILGPSGAGKSTVLNILGGMDTPTSGKIIVDGQDISEFDDYQLTTYRREAVGFIFQNYNLVPNLTAKENVELAVQISPNAKNPVSVLESVGLKDKLDHFPAELSGGEQQRVSIARAVAKNPKLLLCDEPTGALDIETGKQVLQLLRDTCIILKTTVIVITHNQEIAKLADRVIRINDGKVESITFHEVPATVDELDW